MFIDRASIKVEAGKGGDGAVSFRREIYEPNGGPDGGDGGKGGDIILKVDTGLRTLMDFRYKKKYVARNGENGAKKNQYGKAADDLIISVPQGTVIFEANTLKVMADLSKPDSQIVIAKGGKGGKGNTHFKSSIRQAPDFAKKGEKGESFDIVLELKSIADVGLIGMPNVGKSSLLAKITKAKPKVANYHFTTLFPNLGVVEEIRGKSFVLADIPGLIEGASEGVGLGHDFLRHVERTKILVHVLDISGFSADTPLNEYKTIRNELENYSNKLSKKEEVVLLNKIDIANDEEILNEVQEYLDKNNIKYFITSTVTGKNVSEAMKYVQNLVDNIEEENIYEFNDYYEKEEEKDEIVYYIEDGEYCVEGEKIERIFENVNFFSDNSLRHFQLLLNKIGVIDKLKEMGLKDRDTVRIMGYAFEYKE